MVSIPLSDSAKEAQVIAASNDLANGSSQPPRWEYGDGVGFATTLIQFDLDLTNPYAVGSITAGATGLTNSPVTGTGLANGTATHARGVDRTGTVIWGPLALPSSVSVTTGQSFTLASTLTQL